ncbi:MAG TPA: OB-fold domain-containing protein [Ilumatobacter sp.]|nr:OB-fold domain-containing protein [Ilumatobacter sp.]
MSDVSFFDDGITAGKLLIRVCSSCRQGAFPPMPGCPHCGGERGEIVESDGSGRLYSWTVCHVALDPSLAAEVPYVVGLVDVPEGARLVARIECDADQLSTDLALVATYPSTGPDTGRAPHLVFVPAGHDRAGDSA